jgi:hypothetical protein
VLKLTNSTRAKTQNSVVEGRGNCAGGRRGNGEGVVGREKKGRRKREGGRGGGVEFTPVLHVNGKRAKQDEENEPRSLREWKRHHQMKGVNS